jgi:DNA-binding transcriptional LysR family regulator
MTKRTPAQALSPENLVLLQAVGDHGSLAAAARFLGLVPSAMSYRVRQMEESLDVLLIDRRGNARLTAAGNELVREARRLLLDLNAVANRVKRVASGWEPELTIAIDSLIAMPSVLELASRFYAGANQSPHVALAACPTRLQLRNETLVGTWEALVSGRADLALGVVVDDSQALGIRSASLGEVAFVFAVAPEHPLATGNEPISDALLRSYRAVAVADSVKELAPVTIGLLDGQDVLTVSTMHAKLDAQLRGLGCGFLPEALARPYLEAGRLVAVRTSRKARVSRVSYAWRDQNRGNALNWWLNQLQQARTRAALLEAQWALNPGQHN